MKNLLIVLLFFVLLTGCKSFITEEQIEALKVYEPYTYTLKDDIAVNGTVRLKKGTDVKIYLIGTEDFVKVYAYPVEHSFLKSRRSLLIYVFEDDFENKKYTETQFEEKMSKIIERKK